LEYNPDNLFSAMVNAYVMYAKNRDLNETRDLLIDALEKDSTRLDIMQEVGKIYYYMRDYENAYNYYGKFIEIKEAQNLDIYTYENAKIGAVLSEMGMKEKSDIYFRDYKEYAENNISIYKNLFLAVYYSYMGDTNQAIEKLKMFSRETNYQYWVVLFYIMDPLMDNIKDHPEFEIIFNDLENNFWNNHKRIKASLETKRLL
jgi:tetratricopeptide (TPR) repeat protein